MATTTTIHGPEMGGGAAGGAYQVSYESTESNVQYDIQSLQCSIRHSSQSPGIVRIRIVVLLDWICRVLSQCVYQPQPSLLYAHEWILYLFVPPHSQCDNWLGHDPVQQQQQ
ncbi:hypothetical protein ACA910_017864 [Epithemia clementina (nom. ined.)]